MGGTGVGVRMPVAGVAVDEDDWAAGEGVAVNAGVGGACHSVCEDDAPRRATTVMGKLSDGWAEQAASSSAIEAHAALSVLPGFN